MWVVLSERSLPVNLDILAVWRLLHQASLNMSISITKWVLLHQATLPVDIAVLPPPPPPVPPEEKKKFPWAPVLIGGGITVATIGIIATEREKKRKK